MKKTDKKKVELVSEAKQLFLDAEQYDEYELLGYYKLIKKVCKKTQQPLYNKICISNIRETLDTLGIRHYNVLRYRYWEGNTLDYIGHILCVSEERVRQLESKAFRRIEYAIKRTQSGVNQIEMLNLNVKTYLALKRGGINIIEQLIKLPPEELMEIDRIGRDSVEHIKQRISCYISQLQSTGDCYFEDNPIDILGFSIGVDNALKKAGVFYVNQLFNMPIEEIYSIRGMGTGGINQIIKKKQSLLGNSK